MFPQGVSGQAKYFAPYPIFVESAEGSHVIDADGNEYVDLLMGAGPLLLGHSHPAVTEAIRRQASIMVNPMMPTRSGFEFAERLQSHMQYLERLRFVNTGSEATRSAIRAARAFTGRVMVAKCEGNYHGSDDLFLISTHSRQLGGTRRQPVGVVDYSGMAPRLLDEVLVIPFNDPEAAELLIEAHSDELAAVIVEPVSFSSGGGVPATREFAAALRRVTQKHGIVLIFDEVLCALRFGLAGAPAYLGVAPDLATIGKAVGGGLPLAAFGGKASIMEAVLGFDSAMKIFQSGTFTENPMSIAAGSALLTVLETEDALDRANRAGDLMRSGLQSLLASHNIHGTVTGMDSIFQIHLGVDHVMSRRDVMASDLDATRRFLLGCVAEGVLWPPMHPGVTSAAHTEADVDVALQRIDDMLKWAPAPALRASP